MNRLAKECVNRASADRRAHVDRRIIDFGPRYQATERRVASDRRQGWEDRYGWERTSRWSSTPIYSDVP